RTEQSHTRRASAEERPPAASLAVTHVEADRIGLRKRIDRPHVPAALRASPAARLFKSAKGQCERPIATFAIHSGMDAGRSVRLDAEDQPRFTPCGLNLLQQRHRAMASAGISAAACWNSGL